MSTVVSESAARQTFRLSFYFWIVMVMAVFVFGGFGLRAVQRYATNDPPLPPVVHLHGLVFASWMTLLIAQTSLINAGNVALHRSLGTFGIALGTAVLFTGGLITAIGFGPLSPATPFYYDLLYLSLVAILGFGLLFTLAIRQVRKPENHRRLILFATIPLLPPGINRMYQVSFELNYLPVLATYLTMAAIAAAILIHEWRTTHKIGNASLIGAAVVFGQQLLHAPITRSDWFAAMTSSLLSLVHYR